MGDPRGDDDPLLSKTQREKLLFYVLVAVCVLLAVGVLFGTLLRAFSASSAGVVVGVPGGLV